MIGSKIMAMKSRWLLYETELGLGGFIIITLSCSVILSSSSIIICTWKCLLFEEKKKIFREVAGWVSGWWRALSQNGFSSLIYLQWQQSHNRSKLPGIDLSLMGVYIGHKGLLTTDVTNF